MFQLSRCSWDGEISSLNPPGITVGRAKSSAAHAFQETWPALSWVLWSRWDFVLHIWSFLSTVYFIKPDVDCTGHNLPWLETQSAALPPTGQCVQTEHWSAPGARHGAGAPQPLGGTTPLHLDRHAPLCSTHHSHCWVGKRQHLRLGILCLTLQNPLSTRPCQSSRKSQRLSRDQGIQETHRWEGGVRENCFKATAALNKLNHFRTFLNANMAIC